MLPLDVGKLTEPISKLIESVEKGIGGIVRPKQIVRVAKAEAEANIINAKSELDIAKMKIEIAPEMFDLTERSLSRIGFREVRRQKNIETIVNNAIGFLPEQVNEEPVSDDWIVRFIDSSQDIGDEEMQLLWSKLLAGEVAKPGSFSYRTMELIRILTREDAELFENATKYMCKTSIGLIIVRNSEITDYLGKQFMDYSKILHLESLGLLSASPSQYFKVAPMEYLSLEYNGEPYNYLNEGENIQEIKCFLISKLGEEIYQLCDKGNDEKYIKIVQDFLGSLGFLYGRIESERLGTFE